MAWFLPALASAGEAVGSAAGAVGSTLGDVASTIGGLFPGASGAESAASSLAQGIGALGAPSEAGYLASLGQAVPAGVELLGPSATFTGPGFWGGVLQGITGAATPLASPSAGTSIGTGVGGLLNVLGQLPQVAPGGSAGGGMQPLPISGRQIVNVADRIYRGIEQPPLPLPSGPTQGPIMKMIAGLLQGF
jgi:hypothetical protein